MNGILGPSVSQGKSNMAGHGKQGVVRNLFMWSVGAIYLFAFSSLYVQIPGLYGKNGVLPAKLALREVSSSVEENFWRKPSLLWFMPKLGLDTETGMEFLCLLGMVLSLLAMSLESWRVSITFFVLWFLYFSLFQVGQTFMWFQWDILLLESGFLTILVSPLNLFKSRKVRHHDNITLWLVKWLAFRLMFCSGVVKLSSRCPTWWGLTALDWHYESQCIPTPLAWYAHQLPKWFQRLSVVLTYVILMALSLLFFVPVRSLRIFSFYSQIFFQVLIILTGNYNFFNLLAIALLLAILDDQHIVSFSPSWLVKNSYIKPAPCSAARKIVSRIVALGTVMMTLYWTVRLFALEISSKNVLNSSITFSKDEFFKTVDKVVPLTIWMGIASLSAEIISSFIGCILEKGILNKVWCLLQWTVFSFAALGMFAISLVPYTDISQESKSNLWPVLSRWRHKTDPFELVNSYGLFRSMTGVGGRPEVIIEGSHSIDGPWKEYNFLYKPGNLYQAPPLVAPHQPRIDWQIWFAALGSYDYNPWFVHLVYRLLQGHQDVLDLMARNPFPKRAPKYIRAHLYTYHYTKLPQNMTSVADVIHNNRLVKRWWWREYDREYIPILSVEEPSLISWLNRYGFAKDEAWPERPSGRLYKVIKYLRSIVRKLDAFRFLIGLFASGCLMGIVNCFLLGERPPKSV